MADPVPIRPGTVVRTERALQLLEHVADVLTAFPGEHDGEEPVDIVFVLRGADGSTQGAWAIEGDDVRPILALCGALLTDEALS